MASISFRSAALGLAALACAACQGGPPAAEAAGLAVRLAPAGRTLQGVDALAGLARVSFALDRIERPGEADEQASAVLEGGVPLMRTLDAPALGAGLTFAPLAAGATYRVRAVGYGPSGAPVTDEASARAVAAAGRATPVSLTLTRTDLAFSGTLALPGVTVSPGGFSAPSASPGASHAPVTASWHMESNYRHLGADRLPPRLVPTEPADPRSGRSATLRSVGGEVRFQPRGPGGAPLEAERALAAGATQGPWGAFDPGQGAYVVLWSEGATLRGLRVGQDGLPLGEAATLSTGFAATAQTGVALNEREREIVLMTAAPYATYQMQGISARFRADLGAPAEIRSATFGSTRNPDCEYWCDGGFYSVITTPGGFAGVSFEPDKRRYAIYYTAPDSRVCRCLGRPSDGYDYECLELVP